MHDPRPVGRAHAGGHQVSQVGEAGQQPTHEGPFAVAGPGVDDEASGLVHHGHQVVRVHDAEHHPGLGRHTGRSDLGQLDGEDRSLVERGAPGRDDLAVDQHPPRRHQSGSDGPGHVGHHGHAPVDPHAVEQGRHLGRDDLTATGRAHGGVPGCAPSSDRSPARPPFPGGVARPGPNKRATTTIATPTVMQASARLKVGQ